MIDPVYLVAFDLGNTLVHCWPPRQFPALLGAAVGRVREALRARGLDVPGVEAIRRRVAAENYEAPDFSVRPLEERLARIFGLAALPADVAGEFLAPLLAGSRPYADAIPVLCALRERGLATALVSNTPWGSPADPWRRELVRHGMHQLLDVAVFCRDIGWRKPSPRIFSHLLAVTGHPPHQVLFVGDHPDWDVTGPRACGMQAVLLDREGTHPELPGISGLEEVLRLAGRD